MAQTVKVILTDDIDGTDATETIAFALDGHTYEIDLNQSNATALREALAPYCTAGRKASRKTTRGKNTTQRRTTETPQIRAWAQENGYQVSARGRVHQHIIDAYHQATGK